MEASLTQINQSSDFKNSLQFKIRMHYEILVQCFANILFLSMPMRLAIGDHGTSLTSIQITASISWIFFTWFESKADLQKLRFLKKCKKEGLNNKVCTVGLWKRCRHPNYFGQWMVWNSLMLFTSEYAARILFTDFRIGSHWKISVLWFPIPFLMYHCLRHYTGAVPAEYFSMQKRPFYKQYKKLVPCFFPVLFLSDSVKSKLE